MSEICDPDRMPETFRKTEMIRKNRDDPEYFFRSPAFHAGLQTEYDETFLIPADDPARRNFLTISFFQAGSGNDLAAVVADLLIEAGGFYFSVGDHLFDLRLNFFERSDQEADRCADFSEAFFAPFHRGIRVKTAAAADAEDVAVFAET